MTQIDAVKSAIKSNTAMIWLESPSNPQLKVTDIKSISQIAQQQQALCVVDNTWCTPVLQRPLALGADVVMYSTTKYFGGHSDCLGGALVIGANAPNNLKIQLKQIQKLSGAVPAPFDCWLITRGLKTLKLRLLQQTQNAKRLADFLLQQQGIKAVHYPDLVNHPQHQLSQLQMPNGCGAMLSIQVGDDQQQAMAVIARLKLFTAATSLGGVESLVEHRKSVEGSASNTPENLIRLSVGIEHIDDLIEDWQQALEL
jgi:cystathionine gamma-synthase